MRELKKGDYVLATKYSDGDPYDGYCVGFYESTVKQSPLDIRYIVVDGEGKPYRANGFRRCERISHELGNWLIANQITFEALTRISPLNMWRYRRKAARLECEESAGDEFVKPYRDQIMRESLSRRGVR